MPELSAQQFFLEDASGATWRIQDLTERLGGSESPSLGCRPGRVGGAPGALPTGGFPLGPGLIACFTVGAEPGDPPVPGPA